MVTVVLSALILGGALLTIRAEYKGPRSQVYLFKPLTTLLILLIALLGQQPESPAYRAAIVAGLVFSSIGDILLMVPGDRFLAGLASFLVAHLCYTVAFCAGVQFAVTVWLLLPWALYAAAMLRGLWPHAGAMRVPVLVYGLVIAAMAWRSWERWAQVGGGNALLAGLGAALFVISDSLLAVNRFVTEYSAARALTLGTYYAGQWLIAMSV